MKLMTVEKMMIEMQKKGNRQGVAMMNKIKKEMSDNTKKELKK